MVDTEIAGSSVPLEGCLHVPQAQVVHDRVQVEAAHRVIDSGRTIAEVARELGVHEALLGRWTAEERRRIEAAAASGDEPLTAAERTELARLRKQACARYRLRRSMGETGI